MSKKKKVHKIKQIIPQEPPKGPEKPVEPPPKVESKPEVKPEVAPTAPNVDKIEQIFKDLEDFNKSGPDGVEKSKDYKLPLRIQYEMLNDVMIKIDTRLAFSDKEIFLLVESANQVMLVYGLDFIKTMSLIAFATSHVVLIGFRIPLAIKFLKEKRQKEGDKKLAT